MATKKPAPKSAKKATAPKTCPDCGKPVVNGKCDCNMTGMAMTKGKGGKPWK